MSTLSNRVLGLKESATIKMAQMGKKLKDQGEDIISMSLGEPDFFTPENIKTAAKKAIDDNKTFYTPVPGINELRQAISNKYKKQGIDYAPESIVFGEVKEYRSTRNDPSYRLSSELPCRHFSQFQTTSLKE